MHWFRRLTVGSKLFIGFSVMIVFMAVIGVVGHRSLAAIHGNLEDMFKVRLPSLDYLLQADRDLQQLLVAERSLIFAEPGSKAFEAQIADYETNLKQSVERWNKFKQLVSRPEQRDLLPQYEDARAKWMTLSRLVVEACKVGTPQSRKEAAELSLGPAGQKFEAMRDFLDKLQDMNLESANADHQEASATQSRALLMLAGATISGVVLALLLALIIGRGVTRQLAGIIARLAESSEQVSSASSEVNKAGNSLAQGSSEQAASLEQTSSSMEQMASMTKRNAENAERADSMMKEAAAIVSNANASMRSLRQAMEAINNASAETAKIVKTIDEIAFQTNLLALNAAVEAARAGEAGAGFAVVADEVRSLAMRAAEAAKNTARLIEDSIRDIKSGGELVVATDETFQKVAASASGVGELVGEIAIASNEQAQGIGQVNLAMSAMDKVTQQNAANAEESAAAAQELASQSQMLLGLVTELSGMVGKVGGGSDGKPARVARKARQAENLALPGGDDF